MTSNISLINHASILINSDITILTDPWYFSNSFNNSWSLVYENKKTEIENLISDHVDYIYISHEHPDHFSVKFFTEFSNLLIKKKINILFQKTKDFKVKTFLEGLGLSVIEIETNVWFKLSDKSKILINSCGYLDSYMIFEDDSVCILNTNDCEIGNREIRNIKKFLNFKKSVYLFHQFSFAVWRPDNKWLKDTAKCKLKSLAYLYKEIKPKFIFPFASYIYFSNEYNFYLNKSANTPLSVSKYLFELRSESNLK